MEGRVTCIEGPLLSYLLETYDVEINSEDRHIESPDSACGFVGVFVNPWDSAILLRSRKIFRGKHTQLTLESQLVGRGGRAEWYNGSEGQN